MPSTLVHVAVAGLIGTALLGHYFDLKGILSVMGLTAFIDLDTLLGIWIQGAHRAYLHTLVFPAVLGGILIWDVYVRDESYLTTHWGEYGVRVAWVSIIALVAAHSLYDAFFNGVNLFWPLYDRFYDLSGQLLVSNQRGVVQTFIELGKNGETIRGTTANTHYYTGVDPSRGPEPKNVERVFHVVGTGERLVLTITGFAVVAYRVLIGHQPESG
jgi:hypothetical protein